MPRRRRLTAFAALSLSAAIALTGCSGGQSYSDLSGERETEDELPGLPDYAYESVDTGSSRFVGEHEGASL
nr:hypothetical protein [uncultured Microbacterium sp.]